MIICMTCGDLREADEDAHTDKMNWCHSCRKRMVDFATAWNYIKLAIIQMDELRKRITELEQYAK